MENKVHFGLKRACVWPMFETVNPQTGEITISYGQKINWPGAVSIGLDNDASQEDFYADDGVYYTSSGASKYEGDYESASVPRAFKKAIYGDVEDDNNALIETQDNGTKYFAFAYETSGDIGGQRTIFYRCSATRPSASSTTKEDGTEIQTETVTIKATGRPDTIVIDGEEKSMIRATLQKGDAGYDTFFDAPYVPASVTVEPSVTLVGSAEIAEGEGKQLVAQVVPSGTPVTWASSAEGKAIVDENGYVVLLKN